MRVLSKEARKQFYKNHLLQKEQLKELISHPETKVLGRTDFLEVYEYLEAKFPNLSGVISACKIYKNENTYFCKHKLKVPEGVAGLFMTLNGCILLCYGTVFKYDVVVLHEMLHFISHRLGSCNKSIEVEERIAYCYSIPYLRKKGYTDDWIRDKYLMPFCISTTKTPEEALEKANDYLKSELYVPKEVEKYDIDDRFDII